MDNKPSLENMTAQGQKALARLKQIEVCNKWEKFDTKPCDMFRMQIDGRSAAKGESVVNFNIEHIFKYLDHPETLKQLNPQVNKNQIIHRYSENLYVLHQAYDGIWLVSGRDFVMVTFYHREGNKIYMASTTAQFPLDEVKGVVRGECFIGGFILEKLDEDKTRFIYFSDADVKGSIPSMIKNQLSKKQGAIAGLVEEKMKKNFKP